MEFKRKVNASAKVVPNLFANKQEEEDISYENKPPFAEVDDRTSSKRNSKKDRRSRGPISFLQNSEEKENQKQNFNLEEKLPQQIRQSNEEPQSFNNAQIVINQKPKLLLELSVNDESDQEQKEQSKQQKNCQNKNEKLVRNIDKSHLLDWSSDSEQGEPHETTITQPALQKQQQKQNSLENSIKTVLEQSITKQFLFQKISPNIKLQCLIKRDKSNHEGIAQYNVYFQGNLKHIMTIRKQGIWQYCLYLRHNTSSSFTYTKIATLESTFFGNKFTLLKNQQKFSQLTICYETNLLGLNGPRKLHVYLPKKEVPFEYLHQAYEEKAWYSSIEKCISKSPIWDEKLGSYILNCKGRAIKSSIKNLVITDKNEGEDDYFIIFGKAGPDTYNLDIQYPFNLIQGISVAISSFQRKLMCD